MAGLLRVSSRLFRFGLYVMTAPLHSISRIVYTDTDDSQVKPRPMVIVVSGPSLRPILSNQRVSMGFTSQKQCACGCMCAVYVPTRYFQLVQSYLGGTNRPSPKEPSLSDMPENMPLKPIRAKNDAPESG